MTGFVDLQVNGYAGVDFNADDLTDDQFASVADRLVADGNEIVLATVITAPIDRMLARIGRIAQAIESIPSVARVIRGIHIEGPFISRLAGYVGAHPASHVVEADAAVADRLVDAGCGRVRLLTLAPEQDPAGRITRRLTERGIIVAAGHCDASIDQLKCLIDQGMSLFTHLGNGCPAMLPRHDNIVQRVLSLSDRLCVSFIADGHHVPDFVLANYLRCIPTQNVIIVTDAISAAGLGPGRYSLGDQMVEVDSDGAAWSSDRKHFAGCATTMPEMTRILKTRCGVNEEQIEKWTRHNPLRLIQSMGELYSNTTRNQSLGDASTCESA